MPPRHYLMDPFAAAAAKAALRRNIPATTEAAPPPLPMEAFHRQQPVPPPPRHTRLDEKLAISEGETGDYASYAEINRICGLPVVHPMTPEEVEHYSSQNVRADAFSNPSMGYQGSPGFRLFKAQAESVYAYEMVGGLIGNVGVGDGKTLISLMCGDKAHRKGIERSVLMIPPEVFIQLYEIDVRWARQRVPLDVPIHWIPGKDMSARRALANSGKRGLYVYTYSLLSAKDAEENLFAINPGLIILDECQRVRDRSAARTRRLMRYLDDRRESGNPVEIVAVSGTITSKSIKDYHHLARAALGNKCPMPLSVSLAEDWAAVLDAPASSFWEENSTSNAGPILPLVHWAMRTFPSIKMTEDVHGFRKAFRLRLDHTTGVVNSSDSAIGTSLVISNHPVQHPDQFVGYPEMDRLIKQVNEQWLTPNGDEIEHSILTWKWLYELSSGFYNQLTWPSVQTLADRRKVSLPQAEEIMGKTLWHHQCGQAYHKALRKWLDDSSKQGIDTPLLVRQNIAKYGARDVGDELATLWQHWHSQDFEHRPERDSMAVRVCDFKIQAAAQWASQLPAGEGAILWVYHQEMGRWVYEALVAAGIDALHCPAGPQYNAAILDHANAKRKIVASFTAHGTGKNLQHFQQQYFVQWPRPAHVAEQTLGRTHRTGQQADELIVYTCNTGEFDELNFAACLNDALYIHQTRNKQKLIYANYDPLPRIFPSAVLFERGAQNRRLSREQEAALHERFGRVA